jgi:hypothetical protein
MSSSDILVCVLSCIMPTTIEARPAEERKEKSSDWSALRAE